MIPLNLNVNSSAKGEISSPFSNDSSGWSINYGNGVVQGGASPAAASQKFWIIAAVIGLVLWKKYS